MDTKTMDRLIPEHIAAEMAGDASGAVASYTDDIEHDVVGWPLGPNRGRVAARDFYTHLVQDILTEKMDPVRTYYGDDFCVVEHQWSGTVPGSFLGLPGEGRHITFRMLHIWEFRDNRISRENVWVDSGRIIEQLTAPKDARRGTIGNGLDAQRAQPGTLQ